MSLIQDLLCALGSHTINKKFIKKFWKTDYHRFGEIDIEYKRLQCFNCGKIIDKEIGF